MTNPFSPEGEPPLAPLLNLPYAGFWIRSLALTIDAIVTGIILFPMQMMTYSGMMMGDGYAPMPTGSLLLLNIGVPWIYSAALESSPWQATLGKKVCGLYVTDLEGKRISFGRATGRYFAKFLSALICYIGFLMVAFTARKQGLHDMIADTLVMRRPSLEG